MVLNDESYDALALDLGLAGNLASLLKEQLETPKDRPRCTTLPHLLRERIERMDAILVPRS